MRAILRWGRNAAEGFVFLALTPWWLGQLLAGCRRGAVDGGRCAQALRRWAGYCITGARRFREIWWIPFQLESARDTWRYILLLEKFAVRRFVPSPAPGEIEKALIVRLGHLGDILQTVPLAREWKRQRPAVKIHLLCGPWSASLARRFPVFDRVHEYAPHAVQFHRGDRSLAPRWREEVRLLESLRAESFDALVSTSPEHVVDRVIEQAVAPRMFIGASSELAGYPRSVSRMEKPFDSRMPETEWVNSFLEGLGLERGSTDLEFPIHAQDRQEADDLLTRHHVKAEARLVAVAPGAGWPGKCWPPERFAEVSDAISRAQNAMILVVGSRSEQGLAARVVARMSRPSVLLAGETSLGALAEIIRRCAVLLCNDSAPLHIAAAVGTPTISLFGPTFASKWAPRGPDHVARSAGFDCVGCWYWHPRAACRHDGTCMKRIAVSDVLADMNRMWPAWIRAKEKRCAVCV